jgi:two-component system nitrate/nitrite response regulator NarL
MDPIVARTRGTSTTVTRVSVVIVEDHRMVAESLAARVEDEPDLHVVGVAHDAAEARRLVSGGQVDVVLVDYRLPDADGATLGKELRRSRPRMGVLLYTGFETPEIVEQARRARLSGVVFKSAPAQDLIAAVRAVGRGADWFPAEAGASAAPGSVADLSRRELEVLQLVARGTSVEDIASQLGLSHHTVRNHIRNITGKLGVHSKLEAVARGLQSGLLTLD